MIRFFTVEREYGSEGAEFAVALAEKLGWKLLDQALVDEVAASVGTDSNAVAACDEKPDPWFNRIGKSMWQGAPTSDDPDRLLAALQAKMHDHAKEGHCVIVGRGGSNLLRHELGGFHLFTYASMPRKKRWFEEKYPERSAHAEHEIHAADAARAAYIRKHYGCDWGDRHLYHLMLNSCMGIEAMVHATMDAAGEIAK